MNLLLLLFAFPIATIIFSIVLQKILNSPILVALTIFAAFLITTFTAFDETFLIYAILYTIVAYITAIITRLFKQIIRRILGNCNADNDNEADDNDVCEGSTNCGCENRATFVVNRNMRYPRFLGK